MRTRYLIACGLAALTFGVAGCGDDDGGDSSSASTSGDTTVSEKGEQGGNESSEALSRSKPKVTLPAGAPPSELVVEDLIEGDGIKAEDGSIVKVNYVGVGMTTKKEFDTSFGKEPLEFGLGAGSVIAGWDQGINGMRVGGRRKLVIPANLAYGEQGFPPAIKPNEALVFVVDLVSAY